MEQHICTIFHSLIFSKRLISKNLSDCYPSSVMQIGTAHMSNNIPVPVLQGKVKFE